MLLEILNIPWLGEDNFIKGLKDNVIREKFCCYNFQIYLNEGNLIRRTI